MSEMSEGEPQGVDIPIIHPDELSRRLEDKRFSDRIAAVTTTSIDAVLRLLADPSRDFPVNETGYVNLDLADEVHDELSGRNRPDKITLAKTLTDNDESYGKIQAAMGLLKEKGASPEKIKTLTETGEFEWFTEMALADFPNTEIDKKLSNYKEISFYLHQVWKKTMPLNSQYMQDGERALRDIFPRARDVTGYLKNLRGRGGVQVILGDRARFMNFVETQDSKLIDTSGLSLYGDIPRNLIIGVVPRGEFEQRKLSAA